MTDEIRALLARHRPGYEVTSVAKLGEGLDNITYDINGEVIVRRSKEADHARRSEAIRREADLLAVVAEVSTLPVPEPIFADIEAGALAYFKLPGLPLLEHPVVQPARLAAPLGGFLSHLHQTPVEKVEELVERDTYPLLEWRRDAERDYRKIVEYIPAAARRPVEDFLGSMPPAEPRAAAFCHNDLGAEHVLVDIEASALTGVIDWSDAAIADSVHDLALIYRDLGPEVFELTLGHGEQVQRGVSRRVHNARVRLDRLLAHRIAKPPAPLRFSAELTADTRAEGLALSLRNVIVPGRLGLDRLDVSSTERLLVTGPNGAGKSTLLAVLAGRLEPSQGAVFRRRGLRVGFLEQDVSFPDPSSSAREAYAAALADAPDVPLLGELGLIASRDQGRPVGALSAGQRRRLALAILVARSPHVLLLDEPTNHISLVLAEELEEAFGSAPGAIVVATHDRWLRHHWEGRELRQVAGRRVAPDDAERERRSALHARLP